MLNGFPDVEQATLALQGEGLYRFSSFSSADAVTLVRPFRSYAFLRELTYQGLSIRKRFRATSRHTKGKGLVISVQTIAGHTVILSLVGMSAIPHLTFQLFSCTVGDLGHPSGIGDVSLDSWAHVEDMINVVKRTGHSSYYVEKGMSAMGRTPTQMGISGDTRVQGGGELLARANRNNKINKECRSISYLVGGSMAFTVTNLC
jgi:hypothetical protein